MFEEYRRIKWCLFVACIWISPFTLVISIFPQQSFFCMKLGFSRITGLFTYWPVPIPNWSQSHTFRSKDRFCPSIRF